MGRQMYHCVFVDRSDHHSFYYLVSWLVGQLITESWGILSRLGLGNFVGGAHRSKLPGGMPRGVPKSGARATRKTAGVNKQRKELTDLIGNKNRLLKYHKSQNGDGSHAERIAKLEQEIVELETKREQVKQELKAS